MHRRVPGATAAEMDAIANEISEGMHALWFWYFQKLSAEMASDPAAASARYGRSYICR